MNITIGQLLFDFMPCKYEYELKILQMVVKQFGENSVNVRKMIESGVYIDDY